MSSKVILGIVALAIVGIAVYFVTIKKMPVPPDEPVVNCITTPCPAATGN